jgi:hypothetical protein
VQVSVHTHAGGGATLVATGTAQMLQSVAGAVRRMVECGANQTRASNAGAA